jgi:hypothetical protein
MHTSLCLLLGANTRSYRQTATALAMAMAEEDIAAAVMAICRLKTALLGDGQAALLLGTRDLTARRTAGQLCIRQPWTLSSAPLHRYIPGAQLCRACLR